MRDITSFGAFIGSLLLMSSLAVHAEESTLKKDAEIVKDKTVEAAKKVGQTGKEVGLKVGEAGKEVGLKVADKAVEVGHATRDGAKKVATSVKKGVSGDAKSSSASSATTSHNK